MQLLTPLILNPKLYNTQYYIIIHIKLPPTRFSQYIILYYTYYMHECVLLMNIEGKYTVVIQVIYNNNISYSTISSYLLIIILDNKDRLTNYMQDRSTYILQWCNCAHKIIIFYLNILNKYFCVYKKIDIYLIR